MGDMVLIDADKVRQARIVRGWTATDLAKHAGFSQILRTKVNRGGPISLRSLRKLAGALNTPISELLIENPVQAVKRQTARGGEM